MKRHQIIILFLAFLTQTCLDSTKPLKIKDSQKVIEMSKKPCFGTCPVYDLVVYETGMATFRGIQNTDRLGLYSKKIGQEKVRQLVNECIAANLWQFQEVYKSNVSDLPTVSITYYEGKEKKTIAGKRERPQPVLKIEEMLDEIAFSSGWDLLEAAPSTLPPGAKTNELVVKLTTNVEALAWSKRYDKEEVQLKRPLSTDKTFWLISFNEKIISAPEMLELLRQDPDVFSVQYNQYYQ
jgi:hypothetical protein